MRRSAGTFARPIRSTAAVFIAMLVSAASSCGGGAGEAGDSGLPYGVQIQSVAVSPDYENDKTLLIGTWSGLYRSVDGAMTWAESSKGLERPGLSIPVLDIAFSPGFRKDRQVYAATRLGLMKSTDGGRSWRSVDPPEVRISRSDTPNTDMSVEVAVGPANGKGNRVFAVYRVKVSEYAQPPELRVLFESRDGGGTWTRVGDDLMGAPTYDIQLHADGSVSGSTGKRVVVQTTIGGAWESIADYEPAYRAVVLQSQPGGGRATITGNGYGESMRFGGDEKPSELGFRLGRRLPACLGARRPISYGDGPDCLAGFAVSPAQDADDAVFAVPDEDDPDVRTTVMRSPDGGTSWAKLQLPTFERVAGVALSPAFQTDRTVFVATRSQVFRSSDAGETWQATKPGCEWDPSFPTSVDWAPLRDFGELVDGRAIVKVRAIDYERVDRDGMRVLNQVDTVKVFAGDVPAGRFVVRDGFGDRGFEGHGRCLGAGEEYYLILDGTTHDAPDAATYDMAGHPLTQFRVHDGRVYSLPPWDRFWLSGTLNGLPEEEFVKLVERALNPALIPTPFPATIQAMSDNYDCWKVDGSYSFAVATIPRMWREADLVARVQVVELQRSEMSARVLHTYKGKSEADAIRLAAGGPLGCLQVGVQYIVFGDRTSGPDGRSLYGPPGAIGPQNIFRIDGDRIHTGEELGGAIGIANYDGMTVAEFERQLAEQQLAEPQ